MLPYMQVINMRQFNKVRTSITIEPEVYEKIAEMADKEDRSVSQQINKILKDYLKEQEKGK